MALMPAVLAPLLSITIFLSTPFVSNIRAKSLVAVGLFRRRESMKSRGFRVCRQPDRGKPTYLSLRCKFFPFSKKGRAVFAATCCFSDCTGIPCYPSVQRGVVHRNTALGDDFFQVLIGGTVADVKEHCEQDHFLRILCTFERNHRPTFNWIMPFATQALPPRRSMVKICNRSLYQTRCNPGSMSKTASLEMSVMFKSSAVEAKNLSNGSR